MLKQDFKMLVMGEGPKSKEDTTTSHTSISRRSPITVRKEKPHIDLEKIFICKESVPGTASGSSYSEA